MSWSWSQNLRLGVTLCTGFHGIIARFVYFVNGNPHDIVYARACSRLARTT